MKNDEKDQLNFAQAVQEMKIRMPGLLEVERLKARIMRERYASLIERGFTEAQAMELCKASINQIV